MLVKNCLPSAWQHFSTFVTQMLVVQREIFFFYYMTTSIVKLDQIVWWMRPIYELFCATPCKHPNFWGALPHINPEYGDVCTPSQKKVVLAGFLVVIHQTKSGIDHYETHQT